jgi:hypothetical protein
MKAFPSNEPIYENNVIGVKQNSGMDLRDYFAAKLMITFIADDICLNDGEVKFAATICYEIADAMMEARK